MKEIIFYKTIDNKIPFFDWFFSLKDKTTKQKIYSRLKQVKEGNLGDHKFEKQGVWELRFRNGTRIYYGLDGNVLVVLLYGGTKRQQQKDITVSVNYWEDYKKTKRGIKK